LSLSAADIQEIMRLVEASHFDELILEADGTKLVLRRGAAVAQAVAAPHPAPAAAPPAVTTAATAAPPSPAAPIATPEPAVAEADGEPVTAPMLGTFYRQPKPGAPPFIEVGMPVEADTVIGIIEVMKLMNTVRAGRKGRVTQIVAADGALVEFGETLIRVASEG
jgi:acetyl-CoA carboxylase biotin carboxyl carrier protein